MPFSVAGISERNYHGTGLIVDAARGLVVIDRNTVPVAVGDVKIVFAGSVELPGRVEYVHPLHNLSIVSFDPKLLNGTPIRTARLDLRELRAGEPVTVVGLGADTRLRSLATSVASIEPVVFPLSRTLQFRDTNLEVASLVNSADRFRRRHRRPGGAVRALWSSFSAENNRELVQLNRGIPAELVAEVLKAVQTGKPLYSLEAEFSSCRSRPRASLACRKRGRVAWKRTVPTRRQILSVARVAAGSPAVGVLREGDLLLAIDGKPVNRYREVERASQSPQRDADGRARRNRAEPCADHRGAARQRHRPAADVGGRRAAQATSRDGAAARHPARRRVRRVLSLRLAGYALSALCRAGASSKSTGARRRISTHSSRLCADATTGCRPAAHDHLERLDRGDHTQARQALLAGL